MAAKSIQVRVDEELKKQVESIFGSFGLDTTTAVRIFLHKVAQTKSIPFSLEMDEDSFSPEEEEAILASEKQSYRKEDTFGPFHDSESLVAVLREEN